MSQSNLLADKHGVADAILDAIHYETAAKSRIGQLSLRGRLLTIAQVFRVLDHQIDTGHMFGEACIDLGFLTREQVDQLLVQQRELRKAEMRRIGEALLRIADEP